MSEQEQAAASADYQAPAVESTVTVVGELGKGGGQGSGRPGRPRRRR